METEWLPLKYQQQKLKGWTLIIKVIYVSMQRNDIFFCINSTSWCGGTTFLQSLQQIDFIMQQIVAKRFLLLLLVLVLLLLLVVLLLLHTSSSSSSFFFLLFSQLQKLRLQLRQSTFSWHIILHPAAHIYDFHIFISSSSSFHGFVTNQFNDLLPVGLLAQLVERCTGIAEVKGSNLVQAWTFFRLSFRNCKSCVYNCDDLLSYNSSARSSHIFIHS